MSTPNNGYALEAERCLLGALLLENAPLCRIASVVSPLDFVEQRHQHLFEALLRLLTQSEPVGFVTVYQELDRAGHLTTDFKRYVIELAQEVTTTAHAAHHARLVAAQGQRRQAMGVLQRSLAGLEKEPLEETAEFLEGVVASLQGIASSCQSGGIETVRLSEVESKPVSWLWPNRIALGKLTLLIGDPDLGKSTLALDLAARVSRGATWPDCPDELPPGRVLLATAEDGLEDTIRPRVEAAGGDLERIQAIRCVVARDGERSFSLEKDIRRLDTKVGENEDLRLLVIDPLSAFLGRTETHRDSDVRRVLTPLVALAERRGIAVLGILHLNKGQSQALYRTSGSVAFVALARSVWAVARDPEDRERRLLVPVKNNLGCAQALAFGLVPSPGPAGTTVPTVAWEREPVMVSAEDVLGPPVEKKSEGPRERAGAWLQAELASGPVRASVLIPRAEEHGINKTTLDRAKEKIGAKSFKKAITGPWFWHLLEDHQGSASGRETIFEEPGDLRPDVAENGDPPESPNAEEREDRQATGTATFSAPAPLGSVEEADSREPDASAEAAPCP